MSVFEDIRTARDCGVVRCGMSSQGTSSLQQIAAEFALSSDVARHHEIDESAARRIAYLILTQDLAYSEAVVPPSLATALVDRFFAEFGSCGAHFFTNGNLCEAPGQHVTYSGVGWQPVTNATFDTGVIVIGLVASGVLWVEDED